MPTGFLPWLLAILPWLGLALYHWSDGPGPVIADYAQYLAHARALADGRPYTDTGYIFTGLYPWAGPAAQPPGLPLVLAALFVVFGQSVAVAKIAMLSAGAAMLLLAGRWVAAHSNRETGLATTLLLGLSLEVARLSAVPLSDLPFAAIIWAVVLLYDRPGRFGAGRLAAITLLGAAAVSVRTFGVALAPAVLLYAALHRREYGLRPAIPVAVWAAVFLVANLLFPITVGFRPSMRWLVELPRTVIAHADSYRYALFSAHLYPFPWGPLNDAYHVAAALTAAAGIAFWLRRYWPSFAVLFAVSYVGMLHIVPVLDTRYMWPMHPLMVMGLLLGVAEAGRLAGAARPQMWSLATAGFLAVAAVATDIRTPREPSFSNRPEVRELFASLKELHRAAPARVAFVRPQILALEAGIPGMTIFNAADSVIVRELDRKCITHVVLGDLGLAPKADRDFRGVVQSRPTSFALEFRNEAFAVFRYIGTGCRRGAPDRRRP